MQLCSPLTPKDFADYFALRWQVLRAPWQQPPGSEQDELEAKSWHLMVRDGEQILAAGRLHQSAPGVGQIRYMAVAPGQQGKGLGARILAGLEALADSLGLDSVELNAREGALAFYQKAGYQLLGPAHTLYGVIPHFKMAKAMASTQRAWAKELTDTWHQTIPLSRFMDLRVAAFNGEQLFTRGDFQANSNLHGSLFAGSHYALATLTAWGRVWWQLKTLGLEGDIVLAKGEISYKRPLTQAPLMLSQPVEDWHGLEALKSGRKARVKVDALVTEAGQAAPASLFNGHFAVLPKKDA
ncbi:bifunctional GNAT family N-acetyltransferase/hotdog fold thioesterase [Gallaecimonas kandeliae]|uniref:bifunctional GNAT family N-acetyltransferase/hotdog fold thioesterase n=1 Tax=Gallaecimonas kandeliae TaxID=3029055 RepID=UPI002648B08B|nr:bifunctional GNAT family N-acetyltransferase/hotdog fold thioesterase [Gallaecimonas kandeliae]WKE65586.1 bifunctional GNAT family N-acetyltransferase/hotdog fold thioesterase [Gallaecimonas kandeliae]